MTTRLVVSVVALVLVAAACGSSDAESSDTTATAPTAAGASQDSEEPAPDTTAAQPAEAQAPSGGGNATLTFDNGDVYEFGILCALESQESAGQEILFTVVSYDKPYNLDVTQFGEDSFGGAANISMYDAATYDTIWDASTMHGSDVMLELNGNVVTGSGTFLENGEMGGAEMDGDLVANC